MMSNIGKSAALIQKLVVGTIVDQRRVRNGLINQTEVLLRWSGSEGESHEIWYPLSQIKLEN